MIDLEVILVDENDNPLGTMEKIKAHRKGLLHRAFSVFLFNNKGQLLLQQRSLNKYHAPGLWTNTCCSHQNINESNIDAAKRRVYEELGIQAKAEDAFNFTYRADMGNGLIEFEFDHVLIGNYDGDCFPNPNEVMGYAYVSIEAIKQDIINKPNKYTPWFKIVLPKLEVHLQSLKAA